MSDTPVNENNLSPISGNILTENGDTVNVVSILGGGMPISDRQFDVAQYAPHSGRILGSDGREYSLADLLQNTGGGTAGLSAYQIAVRNGFTGTEAEWLETLKGAQGEQGKTGPVSEVSGFRPDDEGRVALDVLPVLTISPDEDGSLTLPEDAGYGGMLTLASMVGISTDPSEPILTASPLNLAPSVFTTGRNGSCTQRAVNEGVIFNVTGTYGGMQLSIRQSLEAGKTYTASVDILSTTGNGVNALSLRAYNLTKSMYMTSDIPIPSGWDGSRRRVSITFQTSESRYVAGDNVILWLICGATFQAPTFEFLVADTVMVSDAGRTEYVPSAEKIQLTLPALYASEDGKWRDEYADGVIRRYVNAQGSAQLPQYGIAEYRIPLDSRYAYRVANNTPDMRASFSIPRKVVLSGLDEASTRLDASEAGIAELRTQVEGLETKANLSNLRVETLVAQTAAFSQNRTPYSTFSGWCYYFDAAYVGNANHVEVYACMDGPHIMRVFIMDAGFTKELYVKDQALAASGWLVMELPDTLPEHFWLGFYILDSAGLAMSPLYKNTDPNYPYVGNTGDYKYCTGYGTTRRWAGSTPSHNPVMRFLHRAYPDMGTVLTDIATLKGEEPVSVKHTQLYLPESFYAVEGDTLEVFRKGIVRAYDCYALLLTVSAPKGNAYRRRWVYTPQAGDSDFDVSFTLADQAGNMLDARTVPVRVLPARSSPGDILNVLCVGDSLTAGGQWPRELMRRLTGTGGTPEGLALSNIQSIGTKTASDGTRYEGYGGWTFSQYLGSESPFWDTGAGSADFQAYCQRNGFGGIGVCFILLGWNNTTTALPTLRSDAARFIGLLHSAYPTCRIVLLGLQMPSEDGMGGNYGASAHWTWLNILDRVEAMRSMYQSLACDAAYDGVVYYADVASQFDAEYGYTLVETPVNSRSAVRESRQSNGVHPSEAGYMQIADVAYRRFMSLV